MHNTQVPQVTNSHMVRVGTSKATSRPILDTRHMGDTISSIPSMARLVLPTVMAKATSSNQLQQLGVTPATSSRADTRHPPRRPIPGPRVTRLGSTRPALVSRRSMVLTHPRPHLLLPVVGLAFGRSSMILRADPTTTTPRLVSASGRSLQTCSEASWLKLSLEVSAWLLRCRCRDAPPDCFVEFLHVPPPGSACWDTLVS